MNGPSHFAYKWFDQLKGLLYNLDIGWLVWVSEEHSLSSKRFFFQFWFSYNNYGVQGMHNALKKTEYYSYNHD